MFLFKEMYVRNDMVDACLHILLFDLIDSYMIAVYV